uniref:Uncharacterized protein n=1 Tax=Panagrolaimus sp. ES5 TaxID=591445 RepID=A0AC34GMS6_9BILA
MVELNEYDLGNRGELASDDFTLPRVGETVEVELLNGGMSFEMCKDNCDAVTLCFDSDSPNAMGGCESNQCGFQAKLTQDSLGSIDALMNGRNKEVNQQCGTVTIKFPKITFFDLVDSSCYPTKYYDGKVVKLFVKQASPRCSFLKLTGAKKWIPPTSTAAAISSPNPPSNTQESSMSEETMWIIIAVVVVLLVIILACAGFWGYRYWNQKKSVAKCDGKKKESVTDKKITQTTIVKQEKAVEETVEAKTVKDETVEEKKEIIQSKPEKTRHEKDAPKIVAKTPKKKTVEPTQEETPTNKTVEPTVEDTNTNQSIINQQLPPAPTVSVLPGQIHSTRPYALMPRSKSYSKSRKTDSLSGRHDLSMQGMVQNPVQTLKYRNPNLNVDEMQKFYPAQKKPHYLDRREIALLCCRISVMFKIVEELIIAAEQKLIQLGAVLDGNGFISKLPQKALDYLVSSKAPEFIRSFAFGNCFRGEIDSSLGKRPTTSLPLLFVIIFQRRYPAENRRKACAWIRRQLPILRIEFSINEREKLQYPLNAVEHAAEMDRDGFQNVEDVFTHSKEEKIRDAEKKARKNYLGEMRKEKHLKRK